MPPSLEPIDPGGRVIKSGLNEAVPFLNTSIKILIRGMIAIITKPNNSTVIKLLMIFLFPEFFSIDD